MSFIPPLPGEISPAVDRAALSLAYGLTQDDAAFFAGRSARTIRRWLLLPGFIDLVDHYANSSTYELYVQLSSAQSAAVAKLVELLEKAPPNVQLGAANSLLAHGFRAREEVNLQRRLAALEEIAAAGDMKEAHDDHS